MDLRSVLNTSDNGDARRERERERVTPKAAPPTPQQQQHPQQQHQLHHQQQSPGSYQYRDYGQTPQPHPHASPGKVVQPDYPPHHQHQSPPNAYPPQSPYQTPGPYPGRPAPPPLMPANSFHDVRSPSAPGPIASPVTSRQVPTPSGSVPPGGSAGYPFPTNHSGHAEVTSPSQRHQYPPGPYQPQRHDNYSQSHGMAAHPAMPYAQQQQVPQTPSATTPGGAHPYLHQRSQSTQSTPTPTSAQSQQYSGPFARGSPVTAAQPPPADFNRQPSQPPTPRGPPPSAAQRQSSIPAGYPQQPPSPYQQRMSSVGNANSHLILPQSTPPQPSPQQLPLAPAQRVNSSHGSRNSPLIDHHQRPIIKHEREHSLSVSPKTRVPSLPSSAGRASLSVDAEQRKSQAMAIDSEPAVTPAKRKLEDRDLSPKELERKEPRPPPGEVNGRHVPSQPVVEAKKSESPDLSVKTRTLRLEPPIWAQSCRDLGKRLPKKPNFVVRKKTHTPPTNGPPPEGATKTRNDSLDAGRPGNNAAPAEEPNGNDILGSWEPSITGLKPYEEVSKTVADFLFLNVVNSGEMGEIMSRGIKFEIEAKLGTLIDKSTNHRVDRLLESEAILADNGRTAFRSSMTEAHHKAFNDFLNQIVIQTDPRSGSNRVQVQYKHRREIDRFVELPTDLQVHLPGCMRSRLGSRSKNVKVRITYEQKTRQVLGMIVKARIADLDLHLPLCPMDCRISVNLEMDWEGPVQELEQIATSQPERQPDRNKDRLSYTHGHYQIDLTQVTQQAGAQSNAQRADREHELEIELSPDVLIDQGRKAMDGGSHRYQELVEGFVDNIRVLARKARDFH